MEVDDKTKNDIPKEIQAAGQAIEWRNSIKNGLLNIVLNSIRSNGKFYIKENQLAVQTGTVDEELDSQYDKTWKKATDDYIATQKKNELVGNKEYGDYTVEDDKSLGRVIDNVVNSTEGM